ncbi:hypothetical protein D3C75_718240 [compost metagenome]
MALPHARRRDLPGQAPPVYVGHSDRVFADRLHQGGVFAALPAGGSADHSAGVGPGPPPVEPGDRLHGRAAAAVHRPVHSAGQDGPDRCAGDLLHHPRGLRFRPLPALRGRLALVLARLVCRRARHHHQGGGAAGPADPDPGNLDPQGEDPRRLPCRLVEGAGGAALHAAGNRPVAGTHAGGRGPERGSRAAGL